MEFLALFIATASLLAPFVYVAGALWATLWVANSLPECKQAAIELSIENGYPLLLMKVLLPLLVICVWPLTLAIVLKTGAKKL